MAIRPPTNPAAGPTAANPATAPARPKFGAPGAGPAPTAKPPQMPMAFAPTVPEKQVITKNDIATLTVGAATQMGVDIFDIPDKDFNPTAEAAESVAPAPPDDGEHVVEVALSEGNREAYREIQWQQKTNEGMVDRGAVSLALVATVASEQDPFNGRRMYFDVTSFGKKAVGVEGSTNDVSLLLRALGEEPTGRPKTDAYRAMELIKGGYNKIVVATEWHANFPYDKDNPKKNKRPYKVGQENFPRDDAGIPQPLYETPAGEPLRTIAVPVRFARLTAYMWEPSSMEILIARARKEKKWIHCEYQDLWWTPGELEQDQEYGRFRWGAKNFRLKSPEDRLEFLGRKVDEAQKDLASFKKRMESYT